VLGWPAERGPTNWRLYILRRSDNPQGQICIPLFRILRIFTPEGMSSPLPRTVVPRRIQPRKAMGSRAPRRGRTGLIAVCCAIALIVSAQSRLSEYAVKAAYLFNFGKFVRFTPSEATESRKTFDICVVGEDPLGATLDEVAANEQLDNKPVRIVRLKSALEAHACAIAYISAAEGDQVGHDLDALRGYQVLTVSDAADFLHHGGMIQLVMVGNHVRFAVSLPAVRGAQIDLSSELLKVAIATDGSTPAGVRP
jgi:hypothetical protein